eukprot:3527427-Amphidinium_carterae.1
MEVSVVDPALNYVMLDYSILLPELILRKAVWPLLAFIWAMLLPLTAGAIPSSLDVQVASFGHNLLGGPLPQRLFRGSEKAHKWVSADALAFRSSPM